MRYKIELVHKKWGYKVPTYNTTVKGIIELKDFLKNCIDDDFKVSKITKTFNDGRDEEMYKKNINTIRHHSIKIKSKEKETTDDYVSREKVEYMITSGKYANENYEQFIDRLVRQLKNLQSVTSHIKKGHWENGNHICPCCGEDKFKDLDADIWSDWKPNYCPNCGADMRESEER